MRTSRAPLFVGLFFCALALRPQLVGVGPLLPRIEDALDVGHAVAGLLVTIPVLCMGLFAPVAVYFSSRIGSRPAIAACMASLALAGLARALTPGVAGVLLLTFPVGVAIALSGGLLPIAVKERVADRPAFGTGVYATGLNVGSALSATVAVPLAVVLGGWRGSFVVFSALALVGLPLWLRLTRDEPADGRPALRWTRDPLRDATVWWIVGVFALLGLTYYGLTAWLADSYVERGWSEGSAGALAGAFFFSTIPGGLLVPWFADRLGSRRRYLVTSAAGFAAGLLGLVLAPSLGWLFALIGGIAEGALFSLALTLPLDVVDRPGEVGAVSGLMLGVGYTVSALAPFGLGAIRDQTGSFTTGLWLIFGLALLTVAACLPLTPTRLHRRVLHTRAVSRAG